MNDQQYNHCIVVIDGATNGILGTASSDNHVSSLLLGLGPATWSTVLPKWFLSEREEYKVNFDSLDEHYQLNPIQDKVEPLPEKFITEEWINKRRFYKLKKVFLNLWEFQIRRSCRKQIDFFGTPNMMPFLTDQLNKCDPSNNIYTTAIQDWANIQNVSYETAYQELKLRQEGYGLVYIRSHALYTKHAKNISQAKNEPELRKKYEEALLEIYTNRS